MYSVVRATILTLSLLSIAIPAQDAGAATKDAKAAKERLVLMPLRVAEEDKSLQGAMETALVEGLHHKYEVFSGEQVAQKARAIFNKESRSNAKKECDETRCMEDIAVAFQAELIATANVTKKDGGYFLALSVQNIFDNKVKYSKSLTCKNCDAFQVVEKLKELSGASAAVASAPIAEEPPIKINSNDPEVALWEEVKKGNAVEDYQAYLSQYPKGKFIALAKTKLDRLIEESRAAAAQQDQQKWNTATQTNTQDSFASYLEAYPKGQFAALAQGRITKLKREAAEAASRGPQPGQAFKDCADCPEMVVIPAGSFDMGSPGSETGRFDNENPVHRVTLAKPFAMGKTEVTVGEFRRFVQATRYRTDAERNESINGGVATGCVTWEESDKKFDWRAGRYWDNPGYSQTDRQPASCLSWNDVKAYIIWLSKEMGKTYRLPTEAEWEYAARAGTTTSRYWGDNPNDACRYANVADITKSPGGTEWGKPRHECNDGYFFTAPVGNYIPNAFGLYDMMGNVWEWTADTYHNNYNGAPSDGSEWQGDGAKRVLRGGSWNFNPRLVRAANRSDFEASYRYSNFGFRLARTLP